MAELVITEDSAVWESIVDDTLESLALMGYDIGDSVPMETTLEAIEITATTLEVDDPAGDLRGLAFEFAEAVAMLGVPC